MNEVGLIDKVPVVVDIMVVEVVVDSSFVEIVVVDELCLVIFVVVDTFEVDFVFLFLFLDLFFSFVGLLGNSPSSFSP